jgi:hypothetical protein
MPVFLSDEARFDDFQRGVPNCVCLPVKYKQVGLGKKNFLTIACSQANDYQLRKLLIFLSLRYLSVAI